MGGSNDLPLNAMNMSGRTLRLRKSPDFELDNGHTVQVKVGAGLVHVGCVSVEIKAWRELVKQVEQLLEQKL